MNGFRAAVGFLTILPIAPSDGERSGLASARAYFPLAGLLLGLALAAVELALLGVSGNLNLALPWLGFDGRLGEPYSLEEGIFFGSGAGARPLLMSVIAVAALAALTRALHLDGFMDSCDALLGGFDRERRLAILRDPHVGAFAVVGVVCLLLVKVVAIASMPFFDRIGLLILFPCLSRWGMLLAMEFFPYVRSEGIGSAFFADSGERGRRGLRGWLPLAFGTATALAACLLLAGPLGLLLLAAAGGAAWAVAAWARRLLGGVTGDIYGAVNETAEAAVLVTAVIISRDNLEAFIAPLQPPVIPLGAMNAVFGMFGLGAG